MTVFKMSVTQLLAFSKKHNLLVNYKLILIKKVAANAIIAYNSGNTANTIVFPKISCPEPMPAIPFEVTSPWFNAEKKPTNPKVRPAAKIAIPCNIVISEVIIP